MKKLVIALMAFALVITLAGCGGGGGSGSYVDPKIAQYNGQDQLKAIDKDTTSGTKSIREGLVDMETNFVKADLTGDKKKEKLGYYISKDFKNTTKASSSKDELLTTMGSRFNRYIVNDWGFKVTDYDPKNDENATQIETICSIRLDLTKKEGAEGSVNSWNSAVIDRHIIWIKEDGRWKIKSGFPYDRDTDF
ncbi:MAG: hypothetical protein IKP71_08260 [Candidatus Riflebacteria bacterium]|nr:hypothetical protein [Candidatus Riflebacteria bacterium]